MFKIDYNILEPQEEVSFTITDENGNLKHSETVVGDFCDDEEIKETGFDIAKSQGLWPAKY